MIRNIRAYSVFNNSGEPTIEIKVITNSGEYTASVPAGVSKGATEAVSLSVKKALKAFSALRPNIIALDEKEWGAIDDFLRDIGGPKFSRIGSNTALGVSIAAAKAGTSGHLWKIGGSPIAEFPYPVANIIGGGAHGGNAEIQEFLMIPHRAKSPLEAAQTVIDAWSSVGEELARKKMRGGRNRENAWIAGLDDHDTLRFLSDIADDFGMKLGLDVAATSFWNGKHYVYKKLAKKMTPEEQLDFMAELVKEFRLYYLEDPFHENDFSSFSLLTKKVGARCLVIGDDLFTTHSERLREGIEKKAANGIIIKPNQVGTLSQTMETVRLAGGNNMTTVPSHRSGETSDDWISDIAIAFGSPLIKIGLGDMPKYNRLLKLWEDIPDVKMARLPL